MENEIALYAAGYFAVRVAVLATFAYGIYRALRPVSCHA